MMMTALCWYNTVSLIFIYQLNNNQQVDLSLLSDTLSWVWANLCLLFLLNDVCCVDKQQISISGWTQPGLEPTIYRTLCDHVYKYTSNVVIFDIIQLSSFVEVNTSFYGP